MRPYLGRMHLRALVAVLGLLAGCSVQPDLGEQPAKAVQVMPGKFQSQHGLYFKVVDDGSTYMQQLFEHVPIDKPENIVADVDRWQTEEGRASTDYYLSAPSPDIIEHYIGLTVPSDRELAFEQLDATHWRSYLLMPAAELDASAIAHAEASRDPNTDRPIVTVDFTPAGAAHFAEPPSASRARNWRCSWMAR